jgi:hypothetical protein
MGIVVMIGGHLVDRVVKGSRTVTDRDPVAGTAKTGEQALKVKDIFP